MAAPTRKDFLAVVVLPTDSLALGMVKAFIRFPVLFLRWYVMVWDESGAFTPTFQRKLCDACPNKDV